jgi:putative hydrolase of the HAD superfamily
MQPNADGPVEVVCFDLDDTLCTSRQRGSDLLASAFADVGVDPFFTVEDYHARYAAFVADSEDVRDLRANCFAAIARDRGRDPETGRAVARAYAAERDHRAVDPLPGAIEAVERLREDHAVALVTNGDPGMQGQKLDALGLTDAFEAVVHAGYDTPPKPEPDPFNHVLDDLAVEPGRAVHVGNSLHSDVPGAKRAGLGAVWFAGGEVGDASDPEVAPDYLIRSMHELLEPPWVGR